MEPPVPTVAGILLTGGSSRRMGTDKAALRIGGVPAARRLGDLLAAVTAPAVEVGPGRSGLPVAPEPWPGRGPVAAIGAARAELARLGHIGSALVLACDLPLVDEPLLRLIAAWPEPPGSATPASVVPVVAGRPQPLCARLSAPALATAAAMSVATSSARTEQGAPGPSMRDLLAATPATWLDESAWGGVATELTFTDTDRPGDLDALGLAWSAT